MKNDWQKRSRAFYLMGTNLATLNINQTMTILRIKKLENGKDLPLPKYETQGSAGMALKNGITVLNSPGTIDSDYRGEVCAILINHSKIDFTITRGMRIAQIVIAKHEQAKIEEVENLDETTRGAGGFGSTGH